jgi:hypothetical protein
MERAEKLSEELGANILLKREDLQVWTAAGGTDLPTFLPACARSLGGTGTVLCPIASLTLPYP